MAGTSTIGAPAALAARAAAKMSSVAKATCCGSVTPGCHSLPRRSTDTLRQTRTEPSGLATARLRTSPNGAAISELCCGLQAQHRPVEQRGLVEPVERLGQRDVVDVGDADAGAPSAGRAVARRGGKSDSQLVSSSAPVRQKNTEVPSGAATADRSASAGPRRRGSIGASSACARVGGVRRVGGLQADGGNRGAGRVLVQADGRVQQHPGAALLPQLHRLGPVLPGVGETQRGQRALDRGSAVVVDREFGEGEAAQRRQRRCDARVGSPAAAAVGS